MPGSYAKGTTVPAERTREELAKTLDRFGATAFAYMSRSNRELIAFEYHGLGVRLECPLPSPSDDAIRLDRYGHTRTEADIEKRWQVERRRRWRCLLNVVKAKLTAIEDEIETFEQAFLAHIDVGGYTLAERIVPQLQEAVATGQLDLPPMLMASRQTLIRPVSG